MLCMLFPNLHETALFAFFCACALFLTETQTNKQTAVDVKHWKWNTAVDVTLTASRCTSFRSVCCLLLFLVCRWMRNANRQTAVDVTETNRQTAVHLMWSTEQLMLILVFAFKHGEREFTAMMSQHMFWRATSKMSEWKTSGDTAGSLSGFVLGRTLFFLWCVGEGWKQFQLIK